MVDTLEDLVRHVSFMRICDYHIFRLLSFFFAKYTSHIFTHKLAFSMAVSILFVFLLPISVRFRYLERLIANRMAPSMCLDPCGMS